MCRQSGGNGNAYFGINCLSRPREEDPIDSEVICLPRMRNEDRGVVDVHLLTIYL
jgi:hypothetical protein